MEKKELTKELNLIVDNNKYFKKRLKDDWWQVNDRKILDLSVNEFWENFYAEKAVWPVEKFSKEDMKYTNVTRTKWSNKKFVLK